MSVSVEENLASSGPLDLSFLTQPSQSEQITYEPVEKETIPCPQCQATNTLVEDHRSGDQICEQCGYVVQERVISPEAEYRVFSEDSSSYSKIRVGDTYNIFREHSLTERSRLERDEKEFLWDGMKNIDEVLLFLYKGDSVNKPVQERAKELFQQAFHFQVKQKQGAVPMKRSGSSKKLKDQNRLKFSRRKQFVVTCVLQALKEHNINTWELTDLSEHLDGIQVSKYSVRHCMKDLQLPGM